MGAFVKTDTVLDQILAHKVEEVAACKQQRSLSELRAAVHAVQPPLDFVGALRRDTVALIAEVKKASPSKGLLVENFDPIAIATAYAENGAAAISVLTDERFFQGHLRYLEAVRAAVGIPLLRKEFVIDPYQVYEARVSGADAVLLIVAALADGQLADLHQLVLELGMAPLVEVHNEAEMERALQLSAQLIGVNNRDLKTFHVDMETTGWLASLVPPDVTLVAESGISGSEDVRRMGQLGAHAVLVGESLVKADDMAAAVRDYSAQARS
ncbi:MAG: indole-3-glycerol phosphate synthase TrpC [Anaerolineae bacterium]|nr:indole-3-glycerol phosphate synthase TrpC [Anaerolineae bacterium]